MEKNDYKIIQIRKPFHMDLDDKAIADLKMILFKKYWRKVDWVEVEKLAIHIMNFMKTYEEKVTKVTL